MPIKPIGSLFLRFEDNRGSGELGCYSALEIIGETYAESHLTPVRWIAHSCAAKRPGRTSSMWIEYYEAAGLLLWLREGT